MRAGVLTPQQGSFGLYLHQIIAVSLPFLILSPKAFPFPTDKDTRAEQSGLGMGLLRDLHPAQSHWDIPPPRHSSPGKVSTFLPLFPPSLSLSPNIFPLSLISSNLRFGGPHGRCRLLPPAQPVFLVATAAALSFPGRDNSSL